MPEPDASGATAQAAPAGLDLDGALEALLSEGRSRDPEDEPTPDAVADAAARPDAEASAEEPAPTEPKQAKPAEAADEAPDEADEPEPPKADERPPSRREAARLQQERDALAKERDHYKTVAERAGALPEQARSAASAWLGLVPGEDGQSEWAQLDAQAKSADGIRYDVDQRRYNELVERQAVVGALWAVVDEMVRTEWAQHLTDPEVGIDQEAVNKAGSLKGWKAQYRAAVEKAAREAASSELQAKVDDLEARLAQQKAEYEGKLAAARTTRAPIFGGRSADRSEPLPAARTPHDVMTALADSLREEAGQPA